MKNVSFNLCKIGELRIISIWLFHRPFFNFNYHKDNGWWTTLVLFNKEISFEKNVYQKISISCRAFTWSRPKKLTQEQSDKIIQIIWRDFKPLINKECTRKQFIELVKKA